MVFPTVQKYLIILMVVLFQIGVSTSATKANSSQATPTDDLDRISRAFDFYPAESGWGTFFNVEAVAGETVQLKAVVVNTGDRAQDFRVYRQNAFTALGGGFGAAEYGVEPNEVTRWISMDEQLISVDEGFGIELTFDVNVPEGAAPGEYITGIAAEHAEAVSVAESSNFTQKLRYVIPIMIVVPGQVSVDFFVGDISLEWDNEVTLIHIPITNDGDVRIRLEGVVELLDSRNALLATFPVSMDSIYAHDKTILTVGAALTEPSAGYQVRVDFTDSISGINTRTQVSSLDISVASTPVPAAIGFEYSSVTPEPSLDDIQFATIETAISNSGAPVANAQLSIVASLNGDEIERYPISQSLSLPTGETPINTRYIPATGWTSGIWTFELLIETVEPNGAAVVVARQQIEGSITIP